MGMFISSLLHLDVVVLISYPGPEGQTLARLVHLILLLPRAPLHQHRTPRHEPLRIHQVQLLQRLLPKTHPALHKATSQLPAVAEKTQSHTL